MLGGLEMRTIGAIGGLAAAWITIAGTPAVAEVLDAVYRGTMVCDKLPFTKANQREALEVTIDGGKVHYTHVVRLREAPELKPEQGTGTLKGQDITLEGGWDGGAHSYKASYSGTFVRRSAKLKGTQTWTDNGKTVTRACTGAVKRRFKAFLPRAKKS
jgi:hypothetical protein